MELIYYLNFTNEELQFISQPKELAQHYTTLQSRQPEASSNFDLCTATDNNSFQPHFTPGPMMETTFMSMLNNSPYPNQRLDASDTGCSLDPQHQYLDSDTPQDLYLSATPIHQEIETTKAPQQYASGYSAATPNPTLSSSDYSQSTRQNLTPRRTSPRKQLPFNNSSATHTL